MAQTKAARERQLRGLRAANRAATLSTAEKARRGTLHPVRERVKAPKAKGAPPEPILSARHYEAIAEGYATDVSRGTVRACTWVKKAIERQRRDRERARRDPRWPFVWRAEHAAAACAFLERLPHVEGQWSTATITLEPCQVWLVSTLFGWRQRDDPSKRRFTVLYFEVARKAAKSTLMAGIALYHMLEEHEPGAMVVCGATTGSQARIVFGIAQQMVRRSVWLQERGLMALANAVITSTATMKPVNAKASTQDGLNPSCIVLDESHAQKFALHDVLRSAQGARGNPLLLCPTTAGYDLLSVGYALRTTLTKVLDRVFEADHLLGVIYTLDDTDDWRDPQVWVKANPMIGVTPTRPWVERYCLDAQQTPGLEGEFRVKVCSQWLQSAQAWLSMTAWQACADPSLRLEQFEGERCWIGADLAQRNDIAAVVLCFERDDVYVAFLKCYLPRDVVEERARTVPEYLAWARAGLLELTEGDFIDLRRIEADLRDWCGRFAVQAIRCDEYGSAAMISALAEDGHPAALFRKNRQSMTPPANELEARVLAKRFRHDGNSCFTWMASNTVVTRGVDGSMIPKKDRAESPNKIDGIDALLQAMSAMVAGTDTAPKFQTWAFGREEEAQGW